MISNQIYYDCTSEYKRHFHFNFEEAYSKFNRKGYGDKLNSSNRKQESHPHSHFEKDEIPVSNFQILDLPFYDPSNISDILGLKNCFLSSKSK